MKERLTTYHCGKAVIKDKNKLSEAMEKLAEFEEKEKCGEWIDAIELAKIAITLQRQKWIPCSERLPDGEALCCDRVGYMLIGCVREENGRYLAETDDDYLICSAWMPLPDPYKEEEHEQTN